MPIIEGIPEGVNTSPYPQLQVQAGSGLDFPWAEYCPNVQGLSDCSFGSDGVGAGMVMVIRWPDLLTAVTQLLGYSYRDLPYAQLGTTPPKPILRRKLPWQHPLFDQLWVKRISRVQGVVLQGKGSQGVLRTGGVGGASLPPAGEFSPPSVGYRRSSAGNGAGGSSQSPTTMFGLASPPEKVACSPPPPVPPGH
jgi:hypothetical protein